MKIVVGSLNPLKLQAVESILRKVHPGSECVAVKVESGVSHTPLSNNETIDGARRRAREALKISRADWGVGLEGGLVRIGETWFTSVWCVIWDNSQETLGGGVHFQLPESVVREIIEEGREMGECMDRLTGLTLTNREMGAEGVLTAGLIDRKTTFENAIIYALAPRISQEYYRT